jgi:hypothetical protein
MRNKTGMSRTRRVLAVLALSAGAVLLGGWLALASAAPPDRAPSNAPRLVAAAQPQPAPTRRPKCPPATGRRRFSCNMVIVSMGTGSASLPMPAPVVPMPEPAQLPPAADANATPTPTPTPTPLPVTEARTFIYGSRWVEDVAEECAWSAIRVPETLPGVSVTSRQGQTSACVYGLPEGARVDFELTGPEGERSSAALPVGRPRELPNDGRTATVAGAMIEWPRIDDGEWTLTVRSGDLSESFNLNKVAAEESAWLKSGLADPAERARISPNASNLYAPGTTIEFTGGAFPEIVELGNGFPGGPVEPSVGIYSRERTDLREDFYLHSVVDGAFDANGNLRARFAIPVDMAPGQYLAFPAYPGLETEEGVRFYRGPIAVFEVLPPDPAPDLAAAYVESVGRPLEVTFQALNRGATAAGGGSLSISSPDVDRLEIVSADAPLLDRTSACAALTSHARVLSSTTACNRALQYNSDRRGIVALVDPLAELWQRPWDAGAAHRITVRAWPKADVTQVRFFSRVALLGAGAAPDTVMAPDAAGTADQQGFPVEVIVVDIGR